MRAQSSFAAPIVLSAGESAPRPPTLGTRIWAPGPGDRGVSAGRHDSSMDLIRFGRGIRALRMRRGWRQEDLATESGVSRSVVARIEVGGSEAIPVGKLEKVATAVGARTDVRLSWNGEALDRLLDSAHAGLVEAAAVTLRAMGWEVAAEVTFWIRGERGSVDLLAWHAPTRVVLVIEIKSVVPDIQAMLTSLDRKARLANQIAGSRGWSPTVAGRLLVIGESRTSRRRVEKHAATFAAEFPHRGTTLRGWLRTPSAAEPLRGLWFLSDAHAVGTRHRVPKS